MAHVRFKFTFPPQLIQEPLIYQLGQRFPVVTNIRRASVEENWGWVVLELEGLDEDIEHALDWLREKGVRVDPVVGDVVEG
ncbi:MAG TPA: NIL domain-containing protein [Dehalococcoidia bacterium]|nr:NIL domain-containing protein [Dehalococcoidia bacterium]